MASVHPLALLEAAAEVLAADALPTGYVTERGQDDGTKQSNAVRVVADSIAPEPGLEGTGNWQARLRVIVHTNAHDSTHADHLANCQTVFDAFVVDDIASQLTAALSGFTCLFAYFGPGDQSRTNESWEDSISIECRIACADLSGF